MSSSRGFVGREAGKKEEEKGEGKEMRQKEEEEEEKNLMRDIEIIRGKTFGRGKILSLNYGIRTRCCIGNFS